jgi:ornithine carbamoyltransferase
MQDFLSLKDITPLEWKQLLRLSEEVKRHPSHVRRMLRAKSVVLLFEKLSLRTRLTFELGMKALGGDAVYLDYQEEGLGQRESLYDVSRNLERWFSCIVARTFSHQAVLTLAEYASVPVINALTDEEHPCQALADLFTLQEKWGELQGKKMIFVWDGNNVCSSLIHAAALSGMSLTVISPESHQPYPEAAVDFERLSAFPSARYGWTDSWGGLEGADAVYTDTWVSMGQEVQSDKRVETFAAYRVTAEVMARTGKKSYFMHCLPAHRGQEVSEAVIDSSMSLVFEQAENRLHVQKALLLLLLAPDEIQRYFQLDKSAALR